MPNEKFTPGPWEIESRCAECGVFFRFSFQIIAPSVNKRICYSETDNQANIGAMEANGNLLKAAPDMYSALKMVCVDCEKLSNWEDMFNIGRPEGSIMPKCPCDGCYVKEALMKARGEA